MVPRTGVKDNSERYVDILFLGLFFVFGDLRSEFA
jgi:hypothetical protein